MKMREITLLKHFRRFFEIELKVRNCATAACLKRALAKKVLLKPQPGDATGNQTR